MELIYLYQFNINTQEFKLIECELISKSKINDNYYYLRYQKNGKPHSVTRCIKEEGQPNVERNSIFITGYYPDGNQMDDFKKECIRLLNEYKDKCNENINSLLQTIKVCDNAIDILK